MPASVVAAARENLTEREKQLAEHLARVDKDLRTLEEERRQVTRERLELAESDQRLRSREQSIRDREEAFRKRLDAKLDDQLRAARREIDAVIEGLKTRAAELSTQAAVRLKSGDRMRAAGVSTGDVGAARADARAELDAIIGRAGKPSGAGQAGREDHSPATPTLPAQGDRVALAGIGLEGTVVEIRGRHAEVDVRGKRMRADVRDLQVISGPAPPPQVRVNVDLQPRQGSLSEINVIGCTVDEAVTRLEKFLDESLASDLHEIRIIHGHGTGQLRRGLAAFLKEHPLVAKFDPAPQNQGGGGATIVTLKD
jgi:DNA mismatch repair protein MutS2